MKELDKMLKKLRKKNPQVYAQFLHDLAHCVPVDELEDVLRHAKNISDEDDDTDADDIDPRAIAIAEALEEAAAEYRNGKHHIHEDTIGVDVKIKQIGEE